MGVGKCRGYKKSIEINDKVIEKINKQKQEFLIHKSCKIFMKRKSPTPCRIALFTASSSLATENIRFSSLFAAGDVSRGGKSATQRQKFQTDDVKYVRNPDRSPDWSTE